MFRDSLQKRLKEMEKTDPSSNCHSQGFLKSLSDRAYFLGRVRQGDVERILQKESIYESIPDLDGKVSYFEKFLGYEPLGEEPKDWLLSTVKYRASQGHPQKKVQNWVDRARGEACKLSQQIDSRVFELIGEIYQQGIQERGRALMNEDIAYVENMARKGKGWWTNLRDHGVLNEAIEIAQEIGVDISDRIDKIKKVYFSEGVKHAPKNIREWIAETKKKIQKGEDPSSSFRIAQHYAQDAGLEFQYQLEVVKHLSSYYCGRVIKTV